MALAPGRARACASCGCGDPTLTQVGVEQPYAGRVRISLMISQLAYRDGDAAVIDRRAVVGASGSPLDWLTLSAFLPLVWREVAYPTLAVDHALGTGDAELRARAVLFRDRPFAPEHLISIEVGLRLGTASPVRDAGGGLLPLDAQPGAGSFDPLLALRWSVFAGELSMHTSVLASFPTEGIDQWRNGPSVRASWQGQWQPDRAVALALGIDLRGDTSPAWRGEGQPGAGLAGFVSAGVMVSPATDWLVWTTLRAPVIQLFEGARWDGPIVEAGVAIDVS